VTVDATLRGGAVHVVGELCVCVRPGRESLGREEAIVDNKRKTVEGRTSTQRKLETGSRAESGTGMRRCGWLDSCVCLCAFFSYRWLRGVRWPIDVQPPLG
jgi:hypothetical protein